MRDNVHYVKKWPSHLDRPAFLKALVLEFDPAGVCSGPEVPRIAERICDDPATADGVVERVVSVAVNPDVRLRKQLRQLTRERRVERLPGIARMDAAFMRRVMRDDDRLALERARQFVLQPAARLLMQRESVFRHEVLARRLADEPVVDDATYRLGHSRLRVCASAR